MIKKLENQKINDLKKEIVKLKEQLAIMEEALELACDYVDFDWSGTDTGDKAKAVGGFKNYFIKLATEGLK